MAINETISTGNKYRRLKDATNKIWQRISFWTKASDVEFDNGTTAEESLGNIQGITDSLYSSSSNIAASANAVYQLSNNITQRYTESGRIKVYVGTDGLLHFVNRDGADTALNFSNGIYYLGYGTQFSAASISGYKNMTADNFVIRPDFTSYTDSNANSFTVGKAGGGTSSGTVSSSVGVYLTKTYNASTGVLNCSLAINYNTSRKGGDSDSHWDSNGDKNVSNTYNVSAYCIPDLSKVRSV